MSADLKPEGVAKKKPKKVAAKEKPQPKAKAKFLVKKHKRAGEGEMADWLYCCAIHDNLKNKQVAQLSSKFENYEQIVGDLVKELNSGDKSVEDAVSQLNAIKGTWNDLACNRSARATQTGKGFCTQEIWMCIYLQLYVWNSGLSLATTVSALEFERPKFYLEGIIILQDALRKGRMRFPKVP